jgi:hypothetical protein
MKEIIESMNEDCTTMDNIKITWETQEDILNRSYCNSCKKYKFIIENMNEKNQIKCFHCGNNMNYVHYVFCNNTCFWCWNCSEIQHMDENKQAQSGHHWTCDKQ